MSRFLLSLRVTQKDLQLILFSFLFLYRVFWTDWQKFLDCVQSDVAVKVCNQYRMYLTDRNSGQQRCLLSEISCVKAWNAMLSREINNGGSKRAYERACKCYQYSSCSKLNNILGNKHLPQRQDFT